MSDDAFLKLVNDSRILIEDINAMNELDEKNGDVVSSWDIENSEDVINMYEKEFEKFFHKRDSLMGNLR